MADRAGFVDLEGKVVLMVLAPCPKGCPPSSVTWADGRLYRTTCIECGWLGPTGVTPYDAAMMWNERADPAVTLSGKVEALVEAAEVALNVVAATEQMGLTLRAHDGGVMDNLRACARALREGKR